jgi:serine/threonine protein kinase
MSRTLLVKFPREQVRLVYAKNHDKVYKLGDDFYLKYVFCDDETDAEKELRILRRFMDIDTARTHLMNVLTNEIVTRKGRVYHVSATPNFGYSHTSPIGEMTDTDFIIMTHDLCSALDYLHNEMCLLHRDIHRTNYVFDRARRRWTLIDMDCVIEESATYEILLNQSYADEHHPAILMASAMRTPVRRRSMFNLLLDSRYSHSEYAYRILDWHQLFISILRTTNRVHAPLPYVHACDLAHPVLQLMYDVVSTTERKFRLADSCTRVPTYAYYMDIKRNIDRDFNIEQVRADGKDCTEWYAPRAHTLDETMSHTMYDVRKRIRTKGKILWF